MMEHGKQSSFRIKFRILLKINFQKHFNNNRLVTNDLKKP